MTTKDRVHPLTRFFRNRSLIMEHLLFHDNVLLIFILSDPLCSVFIKNSAPARKRNTIADIPMFILPKAWEASPTTVVPIKDAPFPQISIRPKYSPERSGGTILQNKTGTVPECPLKHSHKDCQHPELPLCLHKHGKNGNPRIRSNTG